jgi:hypothetical protein
MNTAQVSIELVLAGILALCAFVLPFWRGADISQDLLQTDILILVLGGAYLFGVVFDKLADFLLSPFEHYLRLQEANRRLNRGSRSKDPFPQDKLEFKLRKANDGRLDWMNSLKSRIRTSREVAVLGLPASLGFVIYEGVTRDCAINGGPDCSRSWIYMFVGLNIVIFLVGIWREWGADEESSAQPTKAPSPLFGSGKGGRIHTRGLSHDSEQRRDQMRRSREQLRAESQLYYLLVINSAIAMAVVAVFSAEHSWIPLFGAGALIFSLLSFWTWHRITRTYIHFVSKARGERSGNEAPDA